MFKQLFLSTALATAFAVTPVLADEHKKMNKDDPEWEQKVNKTENHADKDCHDKDSKHKKDSKDKNAEGDTTSYKKMDRDGEVRPDQKAYDKNGSSKHPAHEMGEEGYPE